MQCAIWIWVYVMFWWFTPQFGWFLFSILPITSATVMKYPQRTVKFSLTLAAVPPVTLELNISLMATLTIERLGSSTVALGLPSMFCNDTDIESGFRGATMGTYSPVAMDSPTITAPG